MMLRPGDTIWCHDEEDLRRVLRDLSAAGIHAVRDSGQSFRIRITDPEEEKEERT